MAPVLSGIPQGSSVSPILAAIFSKTLADRLQAAAGGIRAGLGTRMRPTEGRLIMFVDDGKIYAASKSFTTNARHLRALYVVTQTWAREFGVQLDEDKRDFAHFTGKLRKVSRRPVSGMARPPLHLPRDDGAGEDVLEPRAQYRWLGVIWDPKLLFTAHVSRMAERAASTVTALSMLGTSRTGLSPRQLRTIHIACTQSILTFASTVWYRAGGRHASRVHKLEVVMRRAMRHILGAFKTTPTDILNLEASIPPLALTLALRNERAAIRYATFPREHPIRQRLGGEWSDGAAAAYPPPLRPRSAGAMTQLQEIARLYPADGERIDPRFIAPWVDPINTHGGRLRVVQKDPSVNKRRAALRHTELAARLRADASALLVYTDGSLLDGVAGAGALLVHQGRTVFSLARGLGQAGDVYDGELAALVEGARAAVREAARPGREITHIYFFADNDAAIGRAASVSPASGQYLAIEFANVISPFLAQEGERRVTLAWVPGHEGVHGNEASDTLAKAGVLRPPSLPVSLSRTRARRDSSDRLLNQWRAAWLAVARRDSFAPANRFPPSTRPTHHLRTLDKALFSRLLQCRTGHAFTGEYFRAINKPERDFACTCGVPLQTRDHLLVGCPELERYRGPLYACSPQLVVADLLGTREGLTATAKFLRSSGAFLKPADEDAAPADA